MKNIRYLMPFIQIAVWAFVIYIIFEIHNYWFTTVYVLEKNAYKANAEVSETIQKSKGDTLCPKGGTWEYYLDSRNWAEGKIMSDVETPPKAVYSLLEQKSKTVEANNAIKKELELPNSTLLYEYAPLTEAGFANRAIAILFIDQCIAVDMGLWCGADLGYITKNSGVQFALIDTNTKQIIDTLMLPSGFVISIVSSAPTKVNETLNLQDYAHDGKACEFYVSSYISCGNTDYQIIGYNYHTDKLQLIGFDLKMTSKVFNDATNEYDLKKDTTYQLTTSSMINPPFNYMKQKSVVKFSTYYGHGDELTNFFTIKFDAQKFGFRGTCISTKDRPPQWFGTASAPN